MRLYTRWLNLSQNRLLDVTNLRLFLCIYMYIYYTFIYSTIYNLVFQINICHLRLSKVTTSVQKILFLLAGHEVDFISRCGVKKSIY